MTKLFHVSFIVSMLLLLKLNSLVSGPVLSLSLQLHTACSARILLLALTPLLSLSDTHTHTLSLLYVSPHTLPISCDLFKSYQA